MKQRRKQLVADSVSGKPEQSLPSDPEKKAETISWRGTLQKIRHRLGGHRYESWLFLVNFKLPLHFRQVLFFNAVVAFLHQNGFLSIANQLIQNLITRNGRSVFGEGRLALPI